jgi:hypothetical protein
LQGIDQILSPLEFYCKELIKDSEVQKKIGKSGQNYNSNKRAILSSKHFSLCLVDRGHYFWLSRVRTRSISMVSKPLVFEVFVVK